MLKIFVVWFLLCVPALAASAFLKEMSDLRAAKSKLYEELAAHPALQNNLSPLPLVGQVDISFLVTPLKIVGVVEAKQTIEIVVRWEMSWRDPDLAWKTGDYGNTSLISLPTEIVWHPSITLLNSADGISLIPTPETATLVADGTLTLKSGSFLRVYCPFDLKLYPYDTQNCGVYLVISGGEAVIRPLVKLLDTSSTNSLTDANVEMEWAITDKTVSVIPSGMGNLVRLQLVIKRASLYYTLCLLLPLIATSLLTLLVFWIPPGSGEKISFLVSIYLSTSLFLSYVSDTLPKNMSNNKNTPRMTQLLIFVIVESVAALAATVLVMRLHHTEQDTKESWLTKKLAGETVRKLVKVNAIGPSSPELIPDTRKGDTGASKNSQNLNNEIPFNRLQDCCLRLKRMEIRSKTLDTFFFYMFFTISLIFYGTIFTI